MIIAWLCWSVIEIKAILYICIILTKHINDIMDTMRRLHCHIDELMSFVFSSHFDQHLNLHESISKAHVLNPKKLVNKLRKHASFEPNKNNQLFKKFSAVIFVLIKCQFCSNWIKISYIPRDKTFLQSQTWMYAFTHPSSLSSLTHHH